MKLLYLGTGAAEGIPAVFCSCPVCTAARKLKGNNIRTRSQALLDGRILFDFPMDTYGHYIASGFKGFDLPAIRQVFITHSHMDHFYPEELQLRRPPFAHPPLETLHIYGNRAVEKLLHRSQEEGETGFNEFHYAKPFESIEAEAYRITPLPALHDRREECLIYTAEKEGKALLYAHDTGIFPVAVWDYFSETRPHFNLVSLDCTTMIHKDGGNHMGIPDAAEVRRRLLEMGAADENTVFVLNHFSHNGGLNHGELCEAAVKESFTVSYDGLEIEV
jgi:phosphoribosyl 1,2-cyclic phosphate phosphodiesterase